MTTTRYRANSLTRDLTPEEVAAMWLYGSDYAKSGLSAIDWWASVDKSHRNIVVDFVRSMRAAFKHAGSLSS